MTLKVQQSPQTDHKQHGLSKDQSRRKTLGYFYVPQGAASAEITASITLSSNKKHAFSCEQVAHKVKDSEIWRAGSSHT